MNQASSSCLVATLAPVLARCQSVALSNGQSVGCCDADNVGQLHQHTQHDAPRKKCRKKKIRTRKSHRRYLDTNEMSNNKSIKVAMTTDHVRHREPSDQCEQRKVFVGQLPSNLNEQHVATIFKPFGDVTKVKICRDKVTGDSERCCFVTFVQPMSAVAACKAMNKAVLFPGTPKPLQVKMAVYLSNLKQRKIFIGAISKQVSEVDLEELFAKHGEIEECVVIKTATGLSKGCAFITYVDKKSAATAIRNNHQFSLRTISADSKYPVVVKLADSKAAKMSKQLERQLRKASTALQHGNSLATHMTSSATLSTITDDVSGLPLLLC